MFEVAVQRAGLLEQVASLAGELAKLREKAARGLEEMTDPLGAAQQKVRAAEAALAPEALAAEHERRVECLKAVLPDYTDASAESVSVAKLTAAAERKLAEAREQLRVACEGGGTSIETLHSWLPDGGHQRPRPSSISQLSASTPGPGQSIVYTVVAQRLLWVKMVIFSWFVGIFFQRAKIPSRVFDQRTASFFAALVDGPRPGGSQRLPSEAVPLPAARGRVDAQARDGGQRYPGRYPGRRYGSGQDHADAGPRPRQPAEPHAHRLPGVRRPALGRKVRRAHRRRAARPGEQRHAHRRGDPHHAAEPGRRHRAAQLLQLLEERLQQPPPPTNPLRPGRGRRGAGLQKHVHRHVLVPRAGAHQVPVVHQRDARRVQGARRPEPRPVFAGEHRARRQGNGKGDRRGPGGPQRAVHPADQELRPRGNQPHQAPGAGRRGGAAAANQDRGAGAWYVAAVTEQDNFFIFLPHAVDKPQPKLVPNTPPFPSPLSPP